MSFMEIKLSHLIKLLHLVTLPSQQFYLCGTLFNVHDTLIKHALRLAYKWQRGAGHCRSSITTQAGSKARDGMRDEL